MMLVMFANKTHWTLLLFWNSITDNSNAISHCQSMKSLLIDGKSYNERDHKAGQVQYGSVNPFAIREWIIMKPASDDHPVLCHSMAMLMSSGVGAIIMLSALLMRLHLAQCQSSWQVTRLARPALLEPTPIAHRRAVLISNHSCAVNCAQSRPIGWHWQSQCANM